MKNTKRPTRRSLKRLVRRWKREAIALRREVSDTNLMMVSLRNRMRAAHASAMQINDHWLITQSQGLKDVVCNIRRNTADRPPNATKLSRAGEETP